jgi:hypothetical protein
VASRVRASVRVATKGVARRTARNPGALMMRTLVSSALLCVSVAASNAAAPDPLAVAFGTIPALWNVRMSPDGTKVSVLKMHPDDLPILMILDLEKGSANLATTNEASIMKTCFFTQVLENWR